MYKIEELLNKEITSDTFSRIKAIRNLIDSQFLYSNDNLNELDEQIKKSAESFEEAKKAKPDVIGLERDLNLEYNDPDKDDEEEIFNETRLDRIEESLLSRDDIATEEKNEGIRNVEKIRNYLREKFKLKIRFNRVNEENEENSGKSLRERIVDLYKQHQKVSIAFLVGVVSLVIGSIITAIIEAVGVRSTTSGSGTSDGGGGDSGGGDDKKPTTWQKVKKVILWILEKLFSMIGSIVAFILNLIKKAVKEMGTTILIGLTATISAIIYFFIYGTQEKMHK